MRFLWLLIIIPLVTQAQDRPSTMVLDVDFDKTIRSYLEFSVPVISCNDLEDMKDDVLILDTRTREEFEISHIPGAKFAGFDSFDEAMLAAVRKDQKIIVYCSIGYRSEKIAERIQSMGYDVANLYGSIFEWVNQDKPIVDKNGNKTHKLHTYNRKWSRWVKPNSVQKIW